MTVLFQWRYSPRRATLLVSAVLAFCLCVACAFGQESDQGYVNVTRCSDRHCTARCVTKTYPQNRCVHSEGRVYICGSKYVVETVFDDASRCGRYNDRVTRTFETNTCVVDEQGPQTEYITVSCTGGVSIPRSVSSDSRCDPSSSQTGSVTLGSCNNVTDVTGDAHLSIVPTCVHGLVYVRTYFGHDCEGPQTSTFHSDNHCGPSQIIPAQYEAYRCPYLVAEPACLNVQRYWYLFAGIALAVMIVASVPMMYVCVCWIRFAEGACRRFFSPHGSADQIEDAADQESTGAARMSVGQTTSTSTVVVGAPPPRPTEDDTGAANVSVGQTASNTVVEAQVSPTEATTAATHLLSPAGDVPPRRYSLEHTSPDSSLPGSQRGSKSRAGSLVTSNIVSVGAATDQEGGNDRNRARTLVASTAVRTTQALQVVGENAATETASLLSHVTRGSHKKKRFSISHQHRDIYIAEPTLREDVVALDRLVLIGKTSRFTTISSFSTETVRGMQYLFGSAATASVCFCMLAGINQSLQVTDRNDVQFATVFFAYACLIVAGIVPTPNDVRGRTYHISCCCSFKQNSWLARFLHFAATAIFLFVPPSVNLYIEVTHPAAARHQGTDHRHFMQWGAAASLIVASVFSLCALSDLLLKPCHRRVSGNIIFAVEAVTFALCMMINIVAETWNLVVCLSPGLNTV